MMAATMEAAVGTSPWMQRMEAELRQVFEANGGMSSPRDVVEWAKANRDSCIYRWMERKGCFDPEEAMRQLQLIMGGRVMRLVKVSYEDAKQEKRFVRIAESVPDLRGGGQRSYAMTERILAEDDMRGSMLEGAKRDLMAFVNRYRNLSALSGFIKEAERALREMLSVKQDGKR